MPRALSPEIERLISPYIDGRRFASGDEVLAFAMRVFAEFDKRYQEDLGDRLKNAFDDIGSSGGVRLETDEDVNAYFDEISRNGWNASKPK